MDGFLFTMLLFAGFLILTVLLISSLKRRQAAYLSILAAALAAWFVGLLLDANLDLGMDLSLRTLFPIMATGLCLLRAIMDHRAE